MAGGDVLLNPTFNATELPLLTDRMASTTAIFFTLAPPPLPPLTFKRHFPNPPPRTFPHFPLRFRQSRVLVNSARPVLGCSGSSVKENKLPSELRQREGRAVHAKNDGEGILLSHEELHKIVKPLASIMPFVDVDGDPNKGVEERKRKLVLQYLSSNGGTIVPVDDYYRSLARVLKEWYTDIREQKPCSRDLDFQKVSKITLLSWIRNFFDFIGKIFSWSGEPLWFCIIGVVLCSFLLPIFLICNCCFRRPDPPPTPPPINPNVAKDLLPFINSSWVKDLLPFFSMKKDLLPLISFRLAMLATQLKFVIPVMIMVAGVK